MSNNALRALEQRAKITALLETPDPAVSRHVSVPGIVHMDELHKIVEATSSLREKLTTEASAWLMNDHGSSGTMSSSQSLALLKRGGLCSRGG